MIILSYAGSLIVAFAYLLLSFNLIKDQSKYFFILLLIGNIFFMTFSIYTKSYPVLLLNIGFGFFAIMAIINKKITASWINYNLFFMSIIITLIASIYINYDKNVLIETMGWFSTITGFGIYFLYTQKKASLLSYFSMNMISNLTFSVYLIFYENYAYMALQMLIFFISLYGVTRLLKEQSNLKRF